MHTRSRIVLWLVGVTTLASLLVFLLPMAWKDHALESPEGSSPVAGVQPDDEQAARSADNQLGSDSRRHLATAKHLRDARASDYGTLIVRVQREGGAAPVAGVNVRVGPLDGSQALLHSRSLPTNAAGRAVFDRIVAGFHQIKLDYGLSREVPVPANQTTEVSFRMAPGLHLRGRVVENGMPVARARIWVYPVGNRSKPEPGRAVMWSDDEGCFRLKGLSTGMRVGARGRGFFPSKLHRVPPSWMWVDQEIVLSLRRPAALLRGKVVDASGAAVAGALVCVARGAGVGRSLPDVLLLTDAQGCFAANDLHPGHATVWASAPGLARAEEKIRLEPGVEDQVWLQLGVCAILTGSVRDSEGAPVAGAHISVQGRKVATDSQGSYRFVDLASGTWPLQAQARNFAGLRRDVELREDVENQQDLTLIALPRISGRILSTAGQGLSGWIVEAQPNGTRDRRSFRGASIERGAFYVGVLPDRTYRLSVREQGQWIAWHCEHLRSVAPNSEPVEIVVPETQRATAYVSFTVVDAKDRPQRVWCQLGEGKRLATPGITMPAPKHEETTGTLLVGPVPPRTYRLTIHSLAKAFPRFRTPEFKLSTDQRLDLGRIRVPVHGWVRYSIRTSGATDLDDVLVQITSREDSRNYTIHKVDVDGEGRWPVVPGCYELVIYGKEIVKHIQPLVVRPNESSRLEVGLRRGVRVQVTVTLPDDEEVLNLILRAEDGRIVFRETIRRDDPYGRRRYALVPPGRVVAEATNPGKFVYSQSFGVQDKPDLQRLFVNFGKKPGKIR